MTIETWLAFVATAALILLLPGPTAIYLITQSLINGRRVTLPLSCGVVLGDFICISCSLLGLSALLAISATAFTVLKLFGAAYLIYLGISMIKHGGIEWDQAENTSRSSALFLFKSVFLITALNPKGIIFFSAFMPQFVNPQFEAIPQLMVLGATFISLAFINAIGYCLLSASLSSLFASLRTRRWINFSGGTALIGAGAITAISKQS